MQRYGPYDVARRIGAGGFGAVYEVRHRETGAAYALKALHPLHDPDARLRFEREAEAMGRLDHPHVARVHAAALEGPTPYLVQELLGGGDLERALEAGPLPLERALELTRQVAEGLAHAHAAGVLHRDLKPSNVLLDDEGRAKLVDFGLARLSDRSRLTESHAVMGSPAYMSPEQAQGQPADERSDVYALGGLLYALLCGRPPFRGQGNVLLLLQAIAREPPPPLRASRPEVPAWVERLCLDALAKDPDLRPASAAAFAERLRSGPSSTAQRRPLVALGALALASAACVALLARGPAPPPSPTPAPSAAPLRAAAQASPSPSPSASGRTGHRRWDRRLKLSDKPCAAWIRGDRLLALDFLGRACAWPLDPDRPGEAELLFDLGLERHADAGAIPVNLFLHRGAWYVVHRYRLLRRVEGPRLTCSAHEVRFCEPAGDDLLLPDIDESTLSRWQPPRGRPSALARAPQAREGDESRILGGAQRLSSGQTFCWTLSHLLLLEPGSSAFTHLPNHWRGPLEHKQVTLAADEDRFASYGDGSQILLGRLSSDDQWQRLPIPSALIHVFGPRGMAFMGDRFYAVGKVGLGAVILAWDLRERRLIHRHRVSPDSQPLNLSVSPAGDLLAVGLSNGQVRLLGVDALDPAH